MSYKVVIEPSGIEMVLEQEETILDAALRHGINLNYGCRNAVCGACKGPLLEGRIHYGGFTPAGLNDEETAAGMILFCRAIPETDLRIEAQHVTSTQSLDIKRLPARVARMERLAADVMRLFLKLPDDQRLRFFAGQYIDILLADGRQRSFSLANPPHDDELLELHIRHVEGGEYTEHVFTAMHEGDLLSIEGPYGNFYLREDTTRPIILIAGGTGFAPIKGLVEHAMAEGLARPMVFYWGARAREDLYLNDLAESWKQKLNLDYHPVLSAARAEDHWTGRTGFVHEAVLADFDDLSGYDVYCCGPPVMVNAAHATFTAHGLPEDRFFSDSFEYARDSKVSSIT